jgi:hypothetical protein
MHNEELHDQGDQIKYNDIGGYVTHIGEMIYAYKSLVGKPEGKTAAVRLGVDVRILLEWILEK